MTRHMSVNIQGLLNHLKGKRDSPMEHNGRNLSAKEARAYLKECQKKGWKYIPTGDCEGFDHFEHGCPGHEIDQPGEQKQ
jgi:hypothetical protein